MLAILRLALGAFGHPAPAVARPRCVPFERWAGGAATHVAFYVLLFAMPLTGWIDVLAKNYSVSWFGLFTWPEPDRQE